MPRQVNKRNPIAGDEMEQMLTREGSIRVRGKTKSRAEVDAALASVNQQAIIDEEDAKLVTEVWDRRSPINGVDAGTILKSRKDIPKTGAIYLIKDVATDRVLVFQPHDPGQGGFTPIQDADVGDMSEDHRQDCVNRAASRRILMEVANVLDPPEG